MLLSTALALLLFFQAAPLTNLVLTGAETATFTDSDTNACYMSDDAFSAQLTDPTSSIIMSFTVKGTVGDHPAVNQLTALSFDGQGENLFVNWSASSGTVTLDDMSAQVPVESGADLGVSASTSGVLGHIEADLTSSQGSFHVSGPFACHSPA